jgi:hypothetical protein
MIEITRDQLQKEWEATSFSNLLKACEDPLPWLEAQARENEKVKGL